MDTKTILIVVLAIGYNCLLGYAMRLAFEPFTVVLFLSIDFFLIFYYVHFLVKENNEINKVGKNAELVIKAKQELKEHGYTKG